MKKMIILAALFATMMMVSPVGATILTFEGLNLVNYGTIPGSYGDNVVSTTDSVGNYLMGSGWTPHITVDYRTVDTIYDHLDYWTTGYGNLVDVAFSAQSGYLAELSLVAEVGYRVTLNSFDIAGWYQADLLNQTLRILDGDYNILMDWSPTAIHGAGPTHDSYSSGIQGQILRIQFGPNWDVGIDNVNFSESQAAVPIPAAAWLLASGLVGLAGLRRKLRK